MQQTQRNSPRDERTEFLATLLTLENISSGYATQYLRNYSTNLNPKQKKKFLSELYNFLILDPEMQVIFEPLDVEYFLHQIQSQTLFGSKADFINSLQSRVTPEFWPLTQKAMLMLAVIF